MSNLMSIMKTESIRLEKMLKKINGFLEMAPEGCLKWQHRRGRTYYYQQYGLQLDENVNIKESNRNYIRKYITKENVALAKKLAKKQYYLSLKYVIERRVKVLTYFENNYSNKEIDEVYYEMCEERRSLVEPIELPVREKVKQWQEEKYEGNMLFSERLRYETEQGEKVRSKSEVIIANILYQNRKDIVYKYECPLEVIENGHKKIIYPDFTIMNVHTGKITYFEHAGLMDDSNYATEFVKKINTYIANGILPGKDVEVTYETSAVPLDISVVKRLINEMANVE